MLCLCAGCHFWSHANPILFTEFVKSYLGKVRYEQLKHQAISLKKWSVMELQEYLKVLNERPL